jgi:hypothetical protein
MYYIVLVKFYLQEFAGTVTYFANIPFFIHTFLLNCLRIDSAMDYTWREVVS